jgi:putative ABC transport system permease protein
MDNLLNDLRYGVRALLKSPGLSIVAIIALALGIGANTAIFSVVNAVLLRPLPFKEADRLVMVWDSQPKAGIRTGVASYLMFSEWKQQNQVFDHVAAVAGQSVNLAIGDDPERVYGLRVSHDFFSMLGIEPALGRAFLEEEQQPGKNRVALLSHALWQRRFSGDTEVIGRQVTLSAESYTVVGVLPPDFQSPTFTLTRPDILVPLPIDPERRRYYLTVMARLKPGVTLARAQTDMDAVASRVAGAYQEIDDERGANIVPMHEQMVGRVRAVLLIFLGAVGFVLAVACANVANILLARAAARQKEIAIRSALGASRKRLVRQLLTESVLLSLIGGAAGLLVAVLGLDLLVASLPENMPRAREINLDVYVLGFTFAVSVVSGLIFGLAPALQFSKPDLNEALKESGATLAGSLKRNRLRSLLLISEMALALVLLVGAGLLIKSFARVLGVNPGFDPKNTLTMVVSLPRQKYPTPGQQGEMFRSLVERVGNLPGVESAGVVNSLPLSGSQEGRSFRIEGRTGSVYDVDRELGFRVASPDYFRTMSIPLLRGRLFNERDTAASPGAVIVNRELARRFFPDEDPIGKRVRLGGQPEGVWSEIVGVVGDVNHQGLDEERHSEIYAPYLQLPTNSMYLVVRAGADPTALVGAIRGEVQTIDSDQPVHNVMTMEERISSSVAQRRFPMFLLSVFAAVALVLAAAGIYGVMSYSVTQRTREIGIRLALGATEGQVLRLVVGHAMAVTLIGVGIGLGGAFALTRVIKSLLYSVSATDAITFVGIPLLLIGVALGASFIPAWRATRISPMAALRYE